MIWTRWYSVKSEFFTNQKQIGICILITSPPLGLWMQTLFTDHVFRMSPQTRIVSMGLKAGREPRLEKNEQLRFSGLPVFSFLGGRQSRGERNLDMKTDLNKSRLSEGVCS